MLTVKNLTKRYGRHTAVSDVSFAIKKGDVVGLLGPNGAGKSTTLKVLTGYLPDNEGRVKISGMTYQNNSEEIKKSIGYMPENVPLYHDMRVKEYLLFRSRLKGVPKKLRKQKIQSALERCSLISVRRKMIKTLSKGYRQRLGLADALLNDPQLLILDEPTNGLDPNQIRSIRNLIKSLGKEHTILLSTHILSEVEMICNKVLILDQGELKASGTPSELIEGMRAAGRVSFEVKAGEEEVLAALKNFPQIKKAKLNSKAEGWFNYSLLVDSQTDTRENLAKLAKKMDWPLRTIHRQGSTLEDVFVELTRKT